MSEVLVSFAEPVAAPDGSLFTARACGGEMDDSRWQGWIEFDALDGSVTLRSRRETTQPNRTDTVYWATGLTPVYLEGSLDRTLRQHQIGPAAIAEPVEPAFDGPLPTITDAAPRHDAVLNPFSVIRKGEALLRRQLLALERWHLVNIISAYDLSERPIEDLNAAPPEELIEVIVAGVRDAETTEP